MSSRTPRHADGADGRGPSRVRWDLLVPTVTLLLAPLLGLHAHDTVRALGARRSAGALHTLLDACARDVETQVTALREALVGLRDPLEAGPASGDPGFRAQAARVLLRHPAAASLAFAVRAPGPRWVVTAAAPPEAAGALEGLDLQALLLPAGPVGPRGLAGLLAALEAVDDEPLGLPGDGRLSLLLAVADPASGRAQPRGVLCCVLELDRVLGRATAAGAAVRAVGVGLALTQGAGRAQRRWDVPGAGGAAPGEPALSEERPLPGLGPTVRLEAVADQAFVDRHRPLDPLLAGLGSASAALLFAGALLGGARLLRRQGGDQEAREAALVLANLGEGVVVADADGRICTASERACQLLGPRPRGGSLREWFDGAGWALPGADDPAAPDAVGRALTGEPVSELPLERLPGAGPGPALALTTRALPPAPDGGARRLLVLRDVTLRQRAQARSERLARAVEQTADLVLITGVDGTIEYVNAAFTESTGYAPEEALGRTPRLLKSGVHPPEHYARLWSTLLSGQVYRGTIVNRRKDGSRYAAEQTISSLRDGQGRLTHFVAVSKDMTEHNRLRRREAELELAARVQQRLFPRAAPRMPGLDVAGLAVPAEETSGDLYDFVPRPGGSLLLVVGDVTGHGVGPALLMSEVRAYVRSLAALPLSLAQILGQVNALLAPDLAEDAFVSLLLVEVGAAPGRLCWANAGHVPGLVIGPGGALEGRLGPTGPALGLRPDPTYRMDDAPPLAPGQVLLLATDGATECCGPDGSPLEEEGLARLTAPVLALGARGIVEHLHAQIVRLSAGSSSRDDVTLVAVRTAGPGADAGPPADAAGALPAYLAP